MVAPLKTLQIHLAGVGLCLLSLGVGYFFGIRPVTDAAQRLESALYETDLLQQRVPQMTRRAAAIAQTIEARQQQLASKYSIATEPNQPILELLSRLLEEQQLELLNLREQRDAKSGRSTVEFKVEGSYKHQVYLLDMLQRLDRPTQLLSFQVNSNGIRGDKCIASLKLIFSPRRTLFAGTPSGGLVIE